MKRWNSIVNSVHILTCQLYCATNVLHNICFSYNCGVSINENSFIMLNKFYLFYRLYFLSVFSPGRGCFRTESSYLLVAESVYGPVSATKKRRKDWAVSLYLRRFGGGELVFRLLAWFGGESNGPRDITNPPVVCSRPQQETCYFTVGPRQRGLILGRCGGMQGDDVVRTNSDSRMSRMSHYMGTRD